MLAAATPCLPLCRPAGWVALWRRLGNLSILSCRRLRFHP